MNWMISTRRGFLRAGTAVAAEVFLPGTLLATGEVPAESALAHDPMRPQFHLLPAKNWMNDPN
jgi:beta-fructofuranosidase